MVISELHCQILNRIKIDIDSKNNLYSRKQILLHYFQLFMVFCSMIFLGNFIWYHRFNVVLFTEGLSVFLTGILTLTKYISFFKKKRQFFDLNEQIKHLTSKVTDLNKRNRILKSNRLIVNIVRIYYISFCAMCTYYILLPNYTYIYEKYVVKPNATIVRVVPVFYR